jgi:hypothetical protein
MGIGAIIILALLGTFAFSRANYWLERNEGLTAAITCVFFIIELSVLVLGNAWVWMVWSLIGAAKSIWLPGEDLKRRMEVMPPGAHHFNIVVTVLVNGLVFALFQWLR